MLRNDVWRRCYTLGYSLCASTHREGACTFSAQVGVNISKGHNGSLRIHTDRHDGLHVVRHDQGMRSYVVCKMKNVIIPHDCIAKAGVVK